MGPTRRYLRITKYSVLEVRIYLDDPSLAQTWLLNPRNPALSRIIETIRPYVLPKLREENARSQGKGKKKKGVKDIVHGDDFEVSVFLTDISTRHALLTKNKTFREKNQRIRSNSNKLTTWLERQDAPDGAATAPITIRDENDDGMGSRLLEDYPEDTITHDSIEPDDVSEDEGFGNETDIRADVQGGDDKKKLGLKTTYEGFSIYGKILCLVVKRRGTKGPESSRSTGGQRMLESWVSTQAAAEQQLSDQGD